MRRRQRLYALLVGTMLGLPRPALADCARTLRSGSWLTIRTFSLSGLLTALLVAPLTLCAQLFISVYVGVVAAYLVPRPLVLPAQLYAKPLSKNASAAVGFCVGMAAAAVVPVIPTSWTGGIRVVERRVGEKGACRTPTCGRAMRRPK